MNHEWVDRWTVIVGLGVVVLLVVAARCSYLAWRFS